MLNILEEMNVTEHNMKKEHKFIEFRSNKSSDALEIAVKANEIAAKLKEDVSKFKV